MTISKKMSFVLTILVLLSSCDGNHKELAKTRKNQNSKLFTNENLNSVLDNYIEHLLNQKNSEIQKQLVMVCASLDGPDTLVSLSTSKYLGEFSIGSNIEWRFLGMVGNREIFIGDQTPELLENYYNMRYLDPYSRSDEIVPNYQDYFFQNSHWKFKLKGKGTKTKLVRII